MRFLFIVPLFFILILGRGIHWFVMLMVIFHCLFDMRMLMLVAVFHFNSYNRTASIHKSDRDS